MLGKVVDFRLLSHLLKLLVVDLLQDLLTIEALVFAVSLLVAEEFLEIPRFTGLDVLSSAVSGGIQIGRERALPIIFAHGLDLLVGNLVLLSLMKLVDSLQKLLFIQVVVLFQLHDLLVR